MYLMIFLQGGATPLVQTGPRPRGKKKGNTFYGLGRSITNILIMIFVKVSHSERNRKLIIPRKD